MTPSTENRPWMQWYKERMKDIEFPEVSVYTLLKDTAEKFPDNTAIIFEDEKTSYNQLKKNVDKLAGMWQEMGFEKGDRIALMMSNHPHYIVCYYAAHALGLIVVQVNPMYTSRELLKIITNSRPQFIVFDGQASKTVDKVRATYSFKVCMSLEEKIGATKSIRAMIETGKAIDYPVSIDPHKDVAIIQYTGGTTGKIKGAMLTHYNLTTNVIQSYEFFGYSMIPGKEIFLTAIPLYHAYAMSSSMNLGVYLGSANLLFPRFNVQTVLDSIKKYRPTFFPGVPKMYNSLMNHPEIEEYGLDCFKICSCASAPLPVEIIKRFEKLSGVVIGEGYGITEASPSVFRNPVFIKRKIGSIGIPYPGTDVMIIDENHKQVEPSEVGQLLIKGPQIMKGYWNNEEETKQSLQNDWFNTGDLAVMDEEGYFYIVGRKTELVIVGGFNVYPQEVESVLYEHPEIHEVAVVGVPHPNFGEMVKAFVVPKEGVTIDLGAVKEYCHSKLTSYKVPSEFEVIQELPRNTVGKILKRKLVEELNNEEISVINHSI